MAINKAAFRPLIAPFDGATTGNRGDWGIAPRSAERVDARTPPPEIARPGRLRHGRQTGGGGGQRQGRARGCRLPVVRARPARPPQGPGRDAAPVGPQWVDGADKRTADKARPNRPRPDGQARIQWRDGANPAAPSARRGLPGWDGDRGATTREAPRRRRPREMQNRARGADTRRNPPVTSTGFAPLLPMIAAPREPQGGPRIRAGRELRATARRGRRAALRTARRPMIPGPFLYLILGHYSVRPQWMTWEESPYYLNIRKNPRWIFLENPRGRI